jgi:tetratricopeptide (TPR) repeat protein
MSLAAQRFPDVSEVRFEYGRLLTQSGRNAEALHEFSEATRLQPAYAEAQQALGCRLVSMNRAQIAAKPLLRATDLDPSLIPARLCLAQIRMQQNRFEDAIQLYRTVLEEGPSNSLALIGLGHVAMLRHELVEAVRNYRAALTLDSDLPSASQNLALALSHLGQYGESLQTLEHGVAASPADLLLRIELAWLLATAPEASLRNGSRALSIAHAVEATENQPTIKTLDAIAAAYAELGRFEEAVLAAQAGLTLARAQNNSQQTAAITTRLSQYKNRRPFHQRKRSREPSRQIPNAVP